MENFSDILFIFIKKFISYSTEILPYFLIATIFGAFIQSFISFNFIRMFINRKYLSPIITGVFGASAPVCSCSMIPIAQTINSLSKGYAPAVSFLISAPILSPVIFFIMLGLFGWELTIFRFVYGFVLAVVSGYLVDLFFKKPPMLPMFAKQTSSQKKLEVFKNAFKDIFIGTGKYVLLGILIASAVSVLIPSPFFSKFADFPFSYLFITLFSIPVYVCSGEEIPIAKSFVDLGLTEGQVLTFMLSSAGICIPTISATFKFFPKGLAVFYVVVWIVGSIVGGILFDFLF